LQSSVDLTSVLSLLYAKIKRSQSADCGLHTTMRLSITGNGKTSESSCLHRAC